MRHYIAVVHQDEDSAYGAYFPDLPGCFSAADDFDDLLPNCTEALGLHLHGVELEDQPRPRSLAEMRFDPEVAAELFKGATMLPVPHIRLSGVTQKANITMDAGLLLAIDKTAKQRGLTRSSYLATLARQDISGA